MKITAVLAMTDVGLIGDRNGLPWDLPEDMKHFREVTRGGTVAMGRNTYLSIPEQFRPLPGRRNIVLSQSTTVSGIECFFEIDDMIESLSGEGVSEIFIIGGAQVYNAFFERNLVDCVELTLVSGNYVGDIYVNEFRGNFREVARLEKEGLSFITLERK